MLHNRKQSQVLGQQVSIMLVEQIRSNILKMNHTGI